MAKKQTKFDLVIGAVNRFTGPWQALEKRLGNASKGLQDVQKNARQLSRVTGITRLNRSVVGLNRGLGGVVSQGQRVSSVLGGAFSRLSLILGGTGGGLIALGKASADASRQARQLAGGIGISTQSLQRLQYAATITQTDAGALTGGMEDLNKAVMGAASGNQKMLEAFRAAGVSFRDENGKLKKSDVLLMELADAFEGVADGAAKAEMAQRLLGASGKQLIPFLSRGSKALKEMGNEAELSGNAVTESAVGIFAAFSASFSRVTAVARGLGNTISAHVLPVITPLLDAFSDWVITNRELIGQRVREWVQAFANALPDIINFGKSALGVLAGLISTVAAFSDMIGGAGNTLKVAAGIIGLTFVPSLFSAATAIGAVGTAILATPVGWFMGAIAGIAGGAYLIYKNWGKISDFFAEKCAAVTASFRQFGEKVSGLIPDWVKNLFGGKTSTVNINAPQMGPSTGAAAAVQQARGVNSTTTNIEKSEVRLVLPPGVTAQGGESARGVTVSQDNLGYQGPWGD